MFINSSSASVTRPGLTFFAILTTWTVANPIEICQLYLYDLDRSRPRLAADLILFASRKKNWCPGWESDSQQGLIPHKLLILRKTKTEKNDKYTEARYTAGTPE